MTILNARNKLDAVVAQLLVEIFNEHVALFSFQMSAVVVFNASVFQRDNVATHGHIVGLHIIAY